VLDFDASKGKTGITSAHKIVLECISLELHIDWILETHADADHISGAQYVKSQLGGLIGIGVGIKSVQSKFNQIFNLKGEEKATVEDFDHLFNDTFDVGNTTLTVLNTLGHTSDSVSYLANGNIFVGDTIFMFDYGTARCDFPGGDAQIMYESIQRLYKLPDSTKVYLCQDYVTAGTHRSQVWVSIKNITFILICKQPEMNL
jgi:glyoxylase-like metal-dependent hydrolase (beta-lactamase superfamily II)